MLRRAALGAAFLLATAVVHPAFAATTTSRAKPASAAASRPPRRRAARRDGRRAGQADAQAPRQVAARPRARNSRAASSPRSELRTEPLPRPSGNLEIVSLANPNDRAKVNIYNPDGSYSLDAVEELNFVLRCRRTDAEKADRLQLLTLAVAHLRSLRRQAAADRLGLPQPAQADEQPLQGPRDGHPHRGRQPKQVRAFAQTLDRGGMGIGLYPRSQFVHIDVRSPPSYRWIDNSPPNSNAAEKRPPRGWKRKKLES